MDIFIEQIVTKKSTLKDTLLKAGIVLLAIVLSVVFFFISGYFNLLMFGMLLAAGAIYGAFYLLSGFNVEYEYIVTNGEIDIDKILAKRRRKRLISVKVSSFEAFGAVKEMPSTFQGTTILASSSVPDEEYFAEFNHSKHGHVRLVFAPNEKVLTGIKPFMPRTLRF